MKGGGVPISDNLLLFFFLYKCSCGFMWSGCQNNYQHWKIMGHSIAEYKLAHPVIFIEHFNDCVCGDMEQFSSDRFIFLGVSACTCLGVSAHIYVAVSAHICLAVSTHILSCVYKLFFSSNLQHSLPTCPFVTLDECWSELTPCSCFRSLQSFNRTLGVNQDNINNAI